MLCLLIRTPKIEGDRFARLITCGRLGEFIFCKPGKQIFLFLAELTQPCIRDFLGFLRSASTSSEPVWGLMKQASSVLIWVGPEEPPPHGSPPTQVLSGPSGKSHHTRDPQCPSQKNWQSSLFSQLQQPSAGGTYTEMSPAGQRSSDARRREDQPTENSTVGTHIGRIYWGRQSL